MLSLVAISVALSPHSKIPFLTDKAQRLACPLYRTGRQISAALATAVFFGRALLLRIQAKRFELPTPFRWSIAQPLDIDATRQAALDSGADQLGSKERERDGHVDMTDASFCASTPIGARLGQGAGSHRYYKRFNFKSTPMEDYEVRDLIRRSFDYGRKIRCRVGPQCWDQSACHRAITKEVR
jgi:hypothetical protein